MTSEYDALQIRIANLEELVKNLNRIPVAMQKPKVYTPTWVSVGSPQPAIGNGTLNGAYILRGKMCKGWIGLTAGTTTTFGTSYWHLGLPFTASNVEPKRRFIGTGFIWNADVQQLTEVQNIITPNLNYIEYVWEGSAVPYLTGRLTSTQPITWATTDELWLDFEFLIA